MFPHYVKVNLIWATLVSFKMHLLLYLYTVCTEFLRDWVAEPVCPYLWLFHISGVLLWKVLLPAVFDSWKD